VLDATLQFGGDCGDDRVGAPASAFQYMTFDRIPATNNNSIPPRTRLSRCLAAATAVPADTGAAAADALSDLGVFSYGVAAGDQTDTSFIAWTRALVSADLEVATNPTFTPVLQTIPGLVPNPARDNVIKTEVIGLTAGTQYYYRFVSGADTSRTGRVRTAPVPSSTAPATFAFTGDSNAFFKPFSVLEGITRDDPELFLYVGDTIYSDDTRSGTGEAMVLADYHLKYRENRDDAALRDLMANVGTATIWDDHEVTNDFYGSPFGAFGAQIIAGNQAFATGCRSRGRWRPGLPQHQVGDVASSS
jgi:phosphodiesterase/alkaline phosphatase D-like protein